MVGRVSDVDGSARADRNALRAVEAGRMRGFAVAEGAGSAGTGDRLDPAARDSSDPMVSSVRNVDAPTVIDGDRMRVVQDCLVGRSTVGSGSRSASPGNGLDPARPDRSCERDCCPSRQCRFRLTVQLRFLSGSSGSPQQPGPRRRRIRQRRDPPR